MAIEPLLILALSTIVFGTDDGLRRLVSLIPVVRGASFGCRCWGHGRDGRYAPAPPFFRSYGAGRADEGHPRAPRGGQLLALLTVTVMIIAHLRVHYSEG